MAKRINEKRTFRGLPEIEFIWHGAYSDPELIYKGESFNYWDVEDALYDMCKDDLEYEGEDINKASDDKFFDKWLLDNEDRVYGMLDDWISAKNESYKSKRINEADDDINEEEFTDRVDANFDISLYEYGVVRNPKNDMTLIGRKPTDEGVYSDYAIMYISLEDVREVLEDMDDSFYRTIDADKETVLANLDNEHLAIHIMDINMENGWWSDQAYYMESAKTSNKGKKLNENKDSIENILWDFMIENELLDERALRMLIGINGDREETYNDAIYYLTGFHDLEQLWDCCKEEFYFSDAAKEYLGVDDDMEESFKSRRKSGRRMNETIYNKYGEPLTDEEWLEREAKGLNEISLEKAKVATEARKERMGKLGAEYGREMLRDWRSYKDKRVKPSKLSRDEMIALGDKWHNSERKYLKDRDIVAKKATKSEALAKPEYDEYEFKTVRRNALANPNAYEGRYAQKDIRKARRDFMKDMQNRKMAKSESFKNQNVMQKIIDKCQSVLSMNESECGEMLTWQFTLSNTTDKTSFGGNNINCTMTEAKEGVAVTNFSMTESQVRKAINEALADNKIKGKVSKLVNLY